MTRDEISERMGWATVVVGMNDRKFPFAAYTDYPIIELGDKPWQKAPMRECRVLGYDGNKYCRVVVEGVELEIKSGYVYEGKGELLPGCRGGGEMTRDEIIRMAREQGLPETEVEGVFRVNSDDLGRFYLAALEAWEAAHEVCAGLCDEIEKKKWETVMHGGEMQGISARDCAAAIRDRGENK
jgi:hypothetical protein